MKTLKKLQLSLVQLHVGLDKQKNIEKALREITKASNLGSKLVVLPECFNSPYGTQYFEKYAEEEHDSHTLKEMSKISKELSIFLVAGSIPIFDSKSKKYFNSSYTFNNKGEIVAKFNKIHLFDIDIPGKITFQESKVLSPGSNLAEFMIDDLKIGIGICFDVRFAELAQIYQRRGCNLLIYPGAFNMTTGPAHWELLGRSRALDNQLYVCLCSPARDTGASYVAYGHSMIADPYGRVVGQLDEKEAVLTQEIDLEVCNEIRQQIPVIKNRRGDMYDVQYKE